jgi:hypothetical protein
MKKLIVLLLALAVTAGAFAQAAAPALTFGAYSDVAVTLVDTAADVDGYAPYFETYVNYKNGPFAFSGTVAVASADIFAALRNYHLQYQVLPQVVVKAGKMREGLGRLTSYVDGNGFNTRYVNVDEGVLAQVAVAGATVGAFLPVNGVALADDLADMHFAAQYAVPNVATLVAGYLLDTEELWVGADVKAVKGVTAKVGFRNVGTTDTSYIYATAGSSSLVKDVNLGLDANVVLGTATDYGVKVLASYTMKTYTFGAEVSFDSGAGWVAYDGLGVEAFASAAFGPGSITASLIFDAGDSTVEVPVEFEMSF